jgi:hypothetical protein
VRITSFFSPISSASFPSTAAVQNTTSMPTLDFQKRTGTSSRTILCCVSPSADVRIILALNIFRNRRSYRAHVFVCTSYIIFRISCLKDVKFDGVVQQD